MATPPVSPAPNGYIRQDQVNVTIKVEGTRYGDKNSWVTATGGKKTAPGAKTRVGGMGAEVELGGPGTRSNAVFTTQMSDVLAGQHSTLQHLIGRGRAVATVGFMTQGGNMRDDPNRGLKGILLGAELPDFDGEATGAVGMYTLTIGCDEFEA